MGLIIGDIIHLGEQLMLLNNNIYQLRNQTDQEAPQALFLLNGHEFNLNILFLSTFIMPIVEEKTIEDEELW